MVKSYKDLKLIRFPVFGLPGIDNLYERDGLLFEGGYVLDDRNQLGGTLGARRLQSPHTLYPLKDLYEDLPAFLRANKNCFIDTNGQWFLYRKTTFVDIKYMKILKVIPKECFCLLKLFGVPFYIDVKRPPPEGKTWVGMVTLNKHPWLPYEYSTECCKTKRRKI